MGCDYERTQMSKFDSIIVSYFTLFILLAVSELIYNFHFSVQLSEVIVKRLDDLIYAVESCKQGLLCGLNEQ